MKTLCVHMLEGIPEIVPGTQLGPVIHQSITQNGLILCPNDVLVIKSKIVSKAEGCLFRKSDLEPSRFARQIAKTVGRPPEYIELVLHQSKSVVKMAPGVLICQTHHGFVLANAGVDATNTGKEDLYAALPSNPDASAREIGLYLAKVCGVQPAVIISDTFGRAWRTGQTDLAIGIFGMDALRDETMNGRDREGRPLYYTKSAVADELAGAAELLGGKDKALPVALIRGFPYTSADGSARALIYPPEEDLFL
ncbi:MAG: coenzyme F420-0:L-glutamate ligase [Christensenellaceae bacterium]|jgi:coenzyme F420-0:L-glutamate ligase/coenzyme F420-1:gamma-L-glutamate ligase|nr:coenzyme F420-0:L-glutamate ligase [Christensenellaceae bacterium]